MVFKNFLLQVDHDFFSQFRFGELTSKDLGKKNKNNLLPHPPGPINVLTLSIQ